MNNYDYRALQTKHQYDPTQIEKVCRIGDLLQQISLIPFLRERLAIYGGTALNFIHFFETQRLSVDVDFNYRHQGEDRDWGDIRKEIDEGYKQILHNLGYQSSNIRIDPSYPLSRFIIHYINHLGTRDSFKIETGYMRRMPILDKDVHMRFRHLGRETLSTIKTPQAEEIYANKWITLLSRATSRDLYDVGIIVKTDVDTNKIRKCAIIESLMSLPQPLTDLEPAKIIRGIHPDPSLQAVLRTRQKIDTETLKTSVIAYSQRLMESLTSNENQLIHNFYSQREFQPERLEQPDINPEIHRHPGILRALQQ